MSCERLKRAAAQFDEWKEKNPNKGNFYADEMHAIYEMAKTDPWRAITTALNAGFMIGYKCAKANTKNTKKEK